MTDNHAYSSGEIPNLFDVWRQIYIYIYFTNKKRYSSPYPPGELNDTSTAARVLDSSSMSSLYAILRRMRTVIVLSL
jgi:hypothetical protein